jgi:hypothetical protein
MPTRQQVEDVLIEKYSSPQRSNPYYNRRKARDNDYEDDPENPEFVNVARELRVAEGPWIVFTASDGHRSLRVASIEELVNTLVEAGLVES